MPRKVICVMGTRPEVIKMAPVVAALRARGMEVPILVTGQHRGLLDQMLATFELRPAWDLDLMQPGQLPGEMAAKILPGLEGIFHAERPDAVLAQGDTTSVFCAALAAFYSGIPFGHVEAGLRSGSLAAPFPEEGMRRLTAVLTRWHFAPTATAEAALLREGHPPATLHQVGNTVIDALLNMAARPDLPWPAEVPEPTSGERIVLLTLHRRENFGEPLRRILGLIAAFARRHPEARIIFPVHPNPRVQEPVKEFLGGIPNLHRVEPLDYPELVRVLQASYLVLTDSGGLQEEAPALGKPVLVFREVTERPEAVEAGGVILVGSDESAFTRAVEALWTDPAAHARMAVPRFPYGDGQSAGRIAAILAGALGGTPSN
jgi:UDP-N-acetylglucosamine 2-epimerase (non-hydrolysing)